MGIFDSLKSLTNSQPKPPPQTTPAPVLAQSAAKKKVLIVEDDQYIRDAYKEELESENYDVITADNGQIGYDTTLSQKPDLILLDLMMPVMDGKTLLSKLREIEEFKKLPVIVITNAGSTDNMKDTQFYNHASDFLIKSNVTPGDVAAKVKSLLSF